MIEYDFNHNVDPYLVGFMSGPARHANGKSATKLGGLVHSFYNTYRSLYSAKMSRIPSLSLCTIGSLFISTKQSGVPTIGAVAFLGSTLPESCSMSDANNIYSYTNRSVDARSKARDTGGSKTPNREEPIEATRVVDAEADMRAASALYCRPRTFAWKER